MKAMILAAGFGKRLKELTAHTPKPLLKVQGKCLIEYRLEALKKAGIKEVVINTWYLADQIREALGDGSHYGLYIHYSNEKELLETGGGVKHALPLLGDEPFILTNSDIMTDFPYETLLNKPVQAAHLVLVDNPPHVPNGDFELQNDQVSFPSEARASSERVKNKYTYSGIAFIHPALVRDIPDDKFPLLQAINPAIAAGTVTGEHYPGQWRDIGRPEDYQEAVSTHPKSS